MIPEITDSPAINIALDTIKMGKQALIFCSTRRSAEATSEKLSKLVKGGQVHLAISNDILKALPQATKQCRRLAFCTKTTVAFHHAGLS